MSWLDALRHVLCVVALMWTGLVNGQPFFFADTTNYIRAADIAVYLASQRTVSTVWTDRYRDALPGQVRAPAPPAAKGPSTANDLSAGLVMSGRSPYIGALMYAGWVTGWFWPFVLMQALVAYALIALLLRRFGLARPAIVIATVLGLAVTTSLPTYNSLLLADGFAPFGLLAFVLLALPGRLGRWERVFLVAVLLIFVTAHLTHLMMLVAMLAVAGLLSLTRMLRLERRVWIAGFAAVMVAVLALQATAFATRLAIGREPQLLPLLTARLYMDGPGRDFIAAGCDGGRFEVCRLPIERPVNNAGWLFDSDPRVGAYMLADPAARRRMGEQDVAFAWAVLTTYPAAQLAASMRNTLRQFVWIDYTGLNQGCAVPQGCWQNLPPGVRATFERSPSGRNLWPQRAMTILLYGVVILSLAVLALAMVRLRRHDPFRFRMLLAAVLLIAAASLVNSAFGGAVADPQYRYQGRLAWLPVLFAIVAMLSALRATSGRTDADAHD